MTTRDAETARLPNGVHVMTKPIGPICNLDCEYCYYLHKEELYPSGERWRMTDETLREYVRQYIAAQPETASEITFAWQGGEPTLLGLEFFQRAVAYQQEFAPARTRIVNTLQTNGVLLNDDWCQFFRKHHFLIGLSIDGPAELHDRYRYDKQGQGTFHAVLNALKLLQRHNVEYNVLVVVNRVNGDYGRKVYTYLRDNGVQFLQFIPIVERRGVGVHAELELPITSEGPSNPWQDRVSSRSVAPEQFGDFLIAVFDEWVRRDVGRVFVQIFDQALAAWSGHEPSLCVFRRQCGGALAMEHNGDLFSCDHFVEPEFRLGNIHELPILDLAASDPQRKFGEAKETTLPQYCRECEVRFMCNGECPKNRFIETPTGEAGLNYLCAGYRKFFNHIRPVMELMAEELRNGRSPANVMHQRRSKSSPKQSSALQTLRNTPSESVGRNAPCPCGSGRKYKKCCLAR
ncbi:anaerobic sulfatase maturase [Thalassoroseus pseudoceratinae]|uniref:anaerobic sulfatase maturase n=1 Tax=Thalassoroseus pseudoceratinae TaxID=2713176 RepID=UPI00141EBBD9|nr:anaerobic sulfatase maturase [Thalassoroseus pseudoceratinae]